LLSKTRRPARRPSRPRARAPRQSPVARARRRSPSQRRPPRGPRGAPYCAAAAECASRTLSRSASGSSTWLRSEREDPGEDLAETRHLRLETDGSAGLTLDLLGPVPLPVEHHPGRPPRELERDLVHRLPGANPGFAPVREHLLASLQRARASHPLTAPQARASAVSCRVARLRTRAQLAPSRLRRQSWAPRRERSLAPEREHVRSRTASESEPPLDGTAGASISPVADNSGPLRTRAHLAP
jgi:hypothetical protein